VNRVTAAGVVALVVAAGTAVALAAGDGDPSSSATDRWSPLTDSLVERTEVGAARIGGSIYVIGGFERQSGLTTNAVERYDIRSDRWSRVRSMPVAVNHSAALAYQGKLYVHGGYRARRDLSSATNVLLRYDPRRDRWKRLPSSPNPRAAEAAAVVGRRLFVAGGANDKGSLRSLEIYDFARHRWRKGPDFKGPARNHTTGAAVGRFFYVLAGRDQQNYRDVDRYDIKRRRWARMPRMRTPRGGIASAVVDGTIVVFGGENLGPGGTTIAPVERFDPRRRRWTSLPDMRTPRHGLGGAALGRRVYALEGGPQPGFHFSRTIEFLDLP
jgi:N-acetylneuraminic acid mutarotase